MTASMLAMAALVSQSAGAAVWRVHEVESPYQPGRPAVRVLCPDDYVAQRPYKVVYVLPVEAGSESRFGDGLKEVQQRGLHNKHQAIFVVPNFTQLPWYADHPTDSAIRQESHLLKVALPLVEQNYATVANREGRLLLGFSKSGWGAWSLLLRHPDTFARAAAWDAPLMMDQAGKYGSLPIFGTQENFAQYKLTDLLSASLAQLQGPPRLILTGYGNFRAEHIAMHERLTARNLPHIYRDGPQRKHDWHSGWVEEAVELLFADPGKEASKR